MAKKITSVNKLRKITKNTKFITTFYHNILVLSAILLQWFKIKKRINGSLEGAFVMIIYSQAFIKSFSKMLKNGKL